jgi:hypothetical protein
VDTTHINWGTDGDTIGRAKLDGTGVDNNFITGANIVTGLAVDSKHIYWTNQQGSSVGRANLDASGVNPAFSAGALGPCGVAIGG